MDIRIGLADAPRELAIELPEDSTPDQVMATVEAGLDAGGMIWLTDRKGRQVGFRADKVTFVDVSSGSAEPRIGFG